MVGNRVTVIVRDGGVELPNEVLYNILETYSKIQVYHATLFST